MPQPTKPCTTRQLKIIMAFEPSISSGVMGAVRIQTPPPYASEDYYMVSADGDRIVFMKETGDKSDSIVDLDMGCCTCPAYRYRAKCRHLSAAKVLRERGAF